MIYFISDLHLGHAGVIDLCHRPFSSVEEMDAVLTENWNKKVKRNDTVYVIGDLIWDKRRASEYLARLAGKKILITGNHDTAWAQNPEVQPYFEAIVPYLETNLNCHPVTLCHYPLLEWKSGRKPTQKKIGYHIHGHIHNRVSDLYRPLYLRFHALNAGADINGFSPVTFPELVENNLRFKLSVLQTQAEKDYLLESRTADPVPPCPFF